jgi:hypothetical protein
MGAQQLRTSSRRGARLTARRQGLNPRMEEFTEPLWAGLVASTSPALTRPHHAHGPGQPTTRLWLQNATLIGW